jgi:ATP-dependent DNA ligase
MHHESLALFVAEQAPSGEEWLHEIKHDGFRVIARKADKRVKLLRTE